MIWPPLIERAHMPGWAKARDIGLTLLAWGVLAWLLHGLAIAFWYATLDVIGIPHASPPWPRGKLLYDIQPYVVASVVLVAWLILFALLRWRLLTNTRQAAVQPRPLQADQLDGAFGLSASECEVLQRSSVVTFRPRSTAP